MARRKRTRTILSKSGENNSNFTITPSSSASAEASARPTHRTADQPKGVLRPTTNTSATSQPAALQTTTCEDIRLMPKEFDSLIGLRRLQLGLDSRETHARHLARLEVEDPVAHYYAQTPSERAPYALQAAGVLFEMSGGDVRAAVAGLGLMKLRRGEREKERMKAGMLLVAGWRAAKAKQEAEEAAEMVVEEEGRGKGKKRALPACEAAGCEPRTKKTKTVRFSGE